MNRREKTKKILPVRGATRIWLAWTAAVLLLPVWSGPAKADQVAIVLSGEAAPYRQAQVGLENCLTREKHTTRTYLLSEAVKKNDALSQQVPVFVAVGTKAALWLHKNVAPPVKLIYCMVSDPEGLGLV